MKNKKKARLSLSRETVRRLQGRELQEAAGGLTLNNCSNWPNCNCTLDETGCGTVLRNCGTCGVSFCLSCPI